MSVLFQVVWIVYSICTVFYRCLKDKMSTVILVFCRFIHFSQNIRLSFALCKSQNSGDFFVDNVDNSVYNRNFPVFKWFYVWITRFVFHSYRHPLFCIDIFLCNFHNLTIHGDLSVLSTFRHRTDRLVIHCYQGTLSRGRIYVRKIFIPKKQVSVYFRYCHYSHFIRIHNLSFSFHGQSGF